MISPVQRPKKRRARKKSERPKRHAVAVVDAPAVLEVEQPHASSAEEDQDSASGGGWPDTMSHGVVTPLPVVRRIGEFDNAGLPLPPPHGYPTCDFRAAAAAPPPPLAGGGHQHRFTDNVHAHGPPSCRNPPDIEADRHQINPFIPGAHDPWALPENAQQRQLEERWRQEEERWRQPSQGGNRSWQQLDGGGWANWGQEPRPLAQNQQHQHRQPPPTTGKEGARGGADLNAGKTTKAMRRRQKAKARAAAAAAAAAAEKIGGGETRIFPFQPPADFHPARHADYVGSGGGGGDRGGDEMRIYPYQPPADFHPARQADDFEMRDSGLQRSGAPEDDQGAAPAETAPGFVRNFEAERAMIQEGVYREMRTAANPAGTIGDKRGGDSLGRLALPLPPPDVGRPAGVVASPAPVALAAASAHWASWGLWPGERNATSRPAALARALEEVRGTPAREDATSCLRHDRCGLEQDWWGQVEEGLVDESWRSGVGGGGYAELRYGAGSSGGVAVHLPLPPLSSSPNLAVDPPLPPALSYQHPPVELVSPQTIMLMQHQQPVAGPWNHSQHQHQHLQHQMTLHAPHQEGPVFPFPSENPEAGRTTMTEALPPTLAAAPVATSAPSRPDASPVDAIQLKPPQPQQLVPGAAQGPTIEQRRAASEALWQHVVSSAEILQPALSPSPSPPPTTTTQVEASTPATSATAVTAAGQDVGSARQRSISASSAPLEPSPNASSGAAGPVAAAAAAAVSAAEAGAAQEKQRSALRNWRSALYDYALVLVGAARLPRQVIAEVMRIPGAHWVDRHELGDPISLPMEVKPVLAKAMAAQLPTCASCDDNEAGRDFLLLMTFKSPEAKATTVTRLAELGVDTSGYDCSPRVQVELAWAAPARLPPPQQSPLPMSSPSSSPAAPAPAPATLAAIASVKTPSTTVAAPSRIVLARERALKALEAERQIAAAANKARAAAAAAAAATAVEDAAAASRAAAIRNVNGGGKKRAESKGVAVKEAGCTKTGLVSDIAAPASKRSGNSATVEGAAAAATTEASAVRAKRKPPADSAQVRGANTAAAKKAPSFAAGQADQQKSAAVAEEAVGIGDGAKRARVAEGPPVRRAASPVPPVRPLSPPATSAPAQPGRGVSPIRRGGGAGNGGGGGGSTRATPPPQKSLSKRLLVVRPSGPPDPTLHPWPYGFSGEYFKLLERGPNMGPCDPSKNASYVGVVLPTQAVVDGFQAERASQGRQQPKKQMQQMQQTQAQRQTQQQTQQPKVAPSCASEKASVGAAAANSLVGFSTASSGDVAGSSVGSSSSSGGSIASSGLAAGVAASTGVAGLAPRQSPVLASPAVAIASPQGGCAGAAARGAAQPMGTSSYTATATAGGKWGARIREAEDELRALQEVKIPRVMEALADVSQQRRKLESTAASLTAKSAAASARLAQDSRDAAAALFAELLARREASKQQRHKQKSQQQQQQQQQ